MTIVITRYLTPQKFPRISKNNVVFRKRKSFSKKTLLEKTII
jgi:hypothetical protein